MIFFEIDKDEQYLSLLLNNIMHSETKLHIAAKSFVICQHFRLSINSLTQLTRENILEILKSLGERFLQIFPIFSAISIQSVAFGKHFRVRNRLQSGLM